MSESLAGQDMEFPCPGCGARLYFSADSNSLECTHCGFREEIPRSSEEVVEHTFDEVATRREIGWGVETRISGCGSCGARTAVESHVRSTTCPFCGSPQVDTTEAVEGVRPESVIPFSVTETEAVTAFQKWIQGLWLRPNALQRLARLGTVQGVYIPHWTFDSLTQSFWSAESGTYYTETEWYTDSEGERQSRPVQKTRWEPASGSHRALFDDCLVHASRGVDVGLIRQIEPFHTEALVAYDPRFLAGWLAEDSQRTMRECWPDARTRMDEAIRNACIRKIPGDTHRGLSIRTRYLHPTCKLCLLPVWIAVYRYRRESYPCLVNGQTGEIHGKAPYSWIKVTFVVLIVLVLVFAILKSFDGAGVAF